MSEVINSICLAEEKKKIKEHRKAHSALLDSSDQLRDELSTLAGISIQVCYFKVAQHLQFFQLAISFVNYLLCSIEYPVHMLIIATCTYHCC